jgi:hypothetical protein
MPRPLYPQGKSPWYPLDKRQGMYISAALLFCLPDSLTAFYRALHGYYTRTHAHTHTRTSCGYEVSGIFFQAYMYTYSLLRGVTFEVLIFSSYALRPTMLPLWETIFESLLWSSFQCRLHIFTTTTTTTTTQQLSNPKQLLKFL